MKLSISELSKKLRSANEIVPLGSTFLHYKGGAYRITDLVINEFTQKVMVVYVRECGTYVKFARPIEEWFDICEHVVPAERKKKNGPFPSETIYKKPRFTLHTKYQDAPLGVGYHHV